MKSVGIDIGTTKTCLLIRDNETGAPLQVINEETGRFIDTGDVRDRIQAPEEIVFKVMKMIEDTDLTGVESIGVTGQMHGILYYDKNGIANSPLYTWQHKRGEEYKDIIGTPVGYGSLTDHYNLENGLIPKGTEGFCTIHDYLVMRLTGRKKALTHSSDAASFGCYDPVKNIFTRDNPRYPEVVNGFEIAGSFKNIPVSVAIGDNQAGFIGSGCGQDEILLNVGTGAQVSCLSDTYRENSGIIETRPLYEEKYMIVGSSLCGGRSYAMLKDFFEKVLSMAGHDEDKDLYKAMDALALKCENDPGLIFDNRFAGTRADPERRGRIDNISENNFTPEAFILGCINGIAQELYDIWTEMKVSGKKGIVASGNGIRKNPLLVSACERLFGLGVEVYPYKEEAAQGAALFGKKAAENR